MWEKESLKKYSVTNRDLTFNQETMRFHWNKHGHILK